MKNGVFELLFPRFCLGCGYLGAYVCPSCEAKMKKVKRELCFYCNKPSLLGLTHPQCRQKNGIDGYLSLYSYDGLFKKLLQESKYKGAYSVLDELLMFPQQKLAQNMNRWNRIFAPCVISVPLHPKRMRERGFNQSDVITEQYFGQGWTIFSNILERKINTEHLAGMKGKHKRKQHVRGAFSFVGTSIRNAVLLVDDVITSGSTILECTKTLKENGVQTVLAFSLAKG